MNKREVMRQEYKDIKVKFTLRVDLAQYMREYQIDSPAQAIDMIKEDIENASVARLEMVGVWARVQ